MTEPAEAQKSDWGTAAAPVRKEFFFWFTLPDGERFNHLDMTAAEAAAIEKRLGCSWWALQPQHIAEHAMAALETFLARKDPEHAATRVAAMTMRQVDAAISYEEGRSDDLPDDFEDGHPK